MPALLSFFVPSLGQFVKGDWKSGIAIWLYLISGTIGIAFLSAVFDLGFISIFLLIFVFYLILWVYQIYDAYNSPVKN